jgi:hypothetical protein
MHSYGEWTSQEATMGETSNAFRILVEKVYCKTVALQAEQVEGNKQYSGF